MADKKPDAPKPEKPKKPPKPPKTPEQLKAEYEKREKRVTIGALVGAIAFFGYMGYKAVKNVFFTPKPEPSEIQTLKDLTSTQFLLDAEVKSNLLEFNSTISSERIKMDHFGNFQKYEKHKTGGSAIRAGFPNDEEFKILLKETTEKYNAEELDFIRNALRKVALTGKSADNLQNWEHHPEYQSQGTFSAGTYSLKEMLTNYDVGKKLKILNEFLGEKYKINPNQLKNLNQLDNENLNQKSKKSGFNKQPTIPKKQPKQDFITLKEPTKPFKNNPDQNLPKGRT